MLDEVFGASVGSDPGCGVGARVGAVDRAVLNRRARSSSWLARKSGSAAYPSLMDIARGDKKS